MDRTISPIIARELFGERTLCGAAKLIFAEHPARAEQPSHTVFGGVTIQNISNETDGNWHMAIGSLIYVPIKEFIWKAGNCGNSLEELICDGGLSMDYWREKIEKE